MADDYKQALDIVNQYYQRIVEQMAYEICEREDSILEGGFGWMEIEDRYANRFFNISQIYCNLKKFITSADEDEGTDELVPDEAAFNSALAQRLSVDERICPSEQVRETIQSWLEEHSEAMVWNLQVIQRSESEHACLFIFST